MTMVGTHRPGLPTSMWNIGGYASRQYRFPAFAAIRCLSLTTSAWNAMECGTEYRLEQVFNVIDSHYHSGKPLIATTNLTLGDLRAP